jgi:hypothetical protein
VAWAGQGAGGQRAGSGAWALPRTLGQLQELDVRHHRLWDHRAVQQLERPVAAHRGLLAQRADQADLVDGLAAAGGGARWARLRSAVQQHDAAADGEQLLLRHHVEIDQVLAQLQELAQLGALELQQLQQDAAPRARPQQLLRLGGVAGRRHALEGCGCDREGRDGSGRSQPASRAAAVERFAGPRGRGAVRCSIRKR